LSTPHTRPEDAETRQIAFVLYPGLTLLDLVGPLQVLLAIGAPYETVVVGAHTGIMPSDTGLGVVAQTTFDDVPEPHVLIVPGGGQGTIRAMADEAVQSYLREAAESAAVVGSVCTGSLVLAAAGLLDGRRATTHWAYERYLVRLGASYDRARWVEDGKFITAAGVSAGIDMALQLTARLQGQALSREVQLRLEYDPQPPFGGIDWSMADADRYWSRFGTPELVRSSMHALLAGRPDLQERMLA
jgi:transcriptional regulator GlxA family with amidase domain